MASSSLEALSADSRKAAQSKETDPLIPATDDKFETCCGLSAFTRKLRQQYGFKLLVLIFAGQQMTTGFIRSMAGKNGAVQYILKDYLVSADQAQMYQAALNGVWTLAPVIGLVSDVRPINGYNKAPYVVLFSMISLVACSVVWLVPQTTLSVKVAITCIFFVLLQVTATDTCTTGAYSRKVNRHSALGADLMVYVSFGIETCSFFASLMTGVVVEDLGAKVVYGICILPVVGCIGVSLMGFFEEEQATEQRTARMRQLFWEQKEVGGLSICMCLAVCFMTGVNIQSYSVDTKFTMAMATGLVLIVSYSLFLTPALAKMTAYAILFNLFNINIESALFYFYTDDREANPNGPHFSPSFFNSVRAPVWSLSAMLGIYLYKRWMKDWNYRKQVIVSNACFAISFLGDLLLVWRCNRHLGIPDTTCFLFTSAMHSISYQWQRMPYRVCFLYLCPSNMETTVYALLSGCSDFGGALSLSLGGLLLDRMGITPNSTSGDASRLKSLPLGILFAAAGPILAAVLFQKLIPDARPNEHLVDDPTAGSLLARFSKEDKHAESQDVTSTA